MINQVISHWNESIINHFTDASNMISGIATPIVTKDGGDVFFPAIIESSGECKYPFADDDFDFGIYHKLQSLDYAKLQNRTYGDKALVQVTADLMLVCWAWVKFASPLEMERTLYNLSPKEVSFVQVNFDRKQVFGSEFFGFSFFLPPELSLFSIKYRVQFTVNKNCVTEIVNKNC